MMRTQVKVRGLTELERALLTLGRTSGRKVLRGAMRAGAKVISDEVKSRAPVGTKAHRFKEKGRVVTVQPGNLKRSIRPRSLSRRQVTRGEMQFIVALAGRGFYGKFLEWGWRAGGQRRYIAPKVRLLGQSFDARQPDALRVIQEETRVGIEREAARLGAKHAGQ